MQGSSHRSNRPKLVPSASWKEKSHGPFILSGDITIKDVTEVINWLISLRKFQKNINEKIIYSVRKYGKIKKPFEPRVNTKSSTFEPWFGTFEPWVDTFDPQVSTYEPQVGPFELYVGPLDYKKSHLSVISPHLSPKLAYLSLKLANLNLLLGVNVQ